MQIILDIDIETIKDKTRIYLYQLVDEEVSQQLHDYKSTLEIRSFVKECWSSEVESIVQTILADEPILRAKVEEEVRNKLKRQISLLMRENKESV